MRISLDSLERTAWVFSLCTLLLLLSITQVSFAGGGVGQECAQACWNGTQNCLDEPCWNNCVGDNCADPCGCEWSSPQQQETCEEPEEQECFEACVDAAEAWQMRNAKEYGFCE